jgi:hypothetical protein
MKRTIVLHSTLAPTTAADALRRSIDEEHRTLFSLSGYKGQRPVLGKITDSTFRVQKRRYWRNDFAPNFYGRFIPDAAGGTRIEGSFSLSPWVRTFMRFWLVGVVLLGGPIFVLTILDMTTGSHYTRGDAWVGVIVPPALALWGFLLPKIGGLFGRSDELYLLTYLEHALAARLEATEPT